MTAADFRQAFLAAARDRLIALRRRSPAALARANESEAALDRQWETWSYVLEPNDFWSRAETDAWYRAQYPTGVAPDYGTVQ